MIEEIQDAEPLPVERPEVPPFPEMFIAFAYARTRDGAEWGQVGMGAYESHEAARNRVICCTGVIASRIVRVPGDGQPSEVQRLRAALQEIADGKHEGNIFLNVQEFARQTLV